MEDTFTVVLKTLFTDDPAPLIMQNLSAHDTLDAIAAAYENLSEWEKLSAPRIVFEDGAMQVEWDLEDGDIVQFSVHSESYIGVSRG